MLQEVASFIIGLGGLDDFIVEAKIARKLYYLAWKMFTLFKQGIYDLMYF